MPIIKEVHSAPSTSPKDTEMAATLSPETLNTIQQIPAPARARRGLGIDYQTKLLPARMDVHCLEELQILCQHGIARDLVVDASAVRFIDAAGLTFLENLLLVRRTAGATVHFFRSSPALTATLELTNSKLLEMAQ